MQFDNLICYTTYDTLQISDYYIFSILLLRTTYTYYVLYILLLRCVRPSAQ